jgi:hypothetical protein
MVMPRQYQNIQFQFLDGDGEVIQAGTVLVRDDSMVLDIPTQQGFAACLIPGEQVGHVFIGSNTLRGENSPHIQAKWADLDGIFVGIWIEEGFDCLFSFRLPRE